MARWPSTLKGLQWAAKFKIKKSGKQKTEMGISCPRAISPKASVRPIPQSARGLAHSKTWRILVVALGNGTEWAAAICGNPPAVRPTGRTNKKAGGPCEPPAAKINSV